MIYINEWFPNPYGNDNADEFIELYNSDDGAVDLRGYQISTGVKKRFSLTGRIISAKGYLSFNKVESKLTLKNSSGSLWLYGPNGQTVDQASFAGPAVEGKSFSRVDYSVAPIGHFAFLYATPGAQNKVFDNAVIERKYPIGVSITRPLSPLSFATLLISTSIFLLLFFIYVTHNNRNISHFFFGRDQEIRP